MSKALCLSLAVKAIEAADEDVKTDALFDFCKANGLGKKDVEALVESVYPTDAGRVGAVFAQKEAAKAAKKEAAENAEE